MAGGLGEQEGDLMAGPGKGVGQLAAEAAGGVVGQPAHFVQRLNCWSGCYEAAHGLKVHFPASMANVQM